MEKDYFQLLGIDKLINAKGTFTSLGGSRMSDQTLEAMRQVSGVFVDLSLLHKKAGSYVADLLGVEAACITAGGAAAIVQSVAACMVGSDPLEISRLPFPPYKNEVIIQRSHRCPFDRCINIAGATMVEIGNLIETPEFELYGAINERTAAVIYFYQASLFVSSLSLEKTIEIAHKNNIPVIVDAAAELPPKSNLWEIYNKGADMVIFSGGKDIRGSGASGLIVGRKDLIDSAELQTAPFEYAVARPMKASKEAIIGFVSALEQYLEEDESLRVEEWERIYHYLHDNLSMIPGVRVSRFQPTQPGAQPNYQPRLLLEVEPAASLNIDQLIEKLAQGEPPIIAAKLGNKALFNTHTLTYQEAEQVVSRIKEMLEFIQ